jgi:hypothetical protein
MIPERKGTQGSELGIYKWQAPYGPTHEPTNTTQFEQIRFVPEAIAIAKGKIMKFDLNIKGDFILCKAT